MVRRAQDSEATVIVKNGVQVWRQRNLPANRERLHKFAPEAEINQPSMRNRSAYWIAECQAPSARDWMQNRDKQAAQYNIPWRERRQGLWQILLYNLAAYYHHAFELTSLHRKVYSHGFDHCEADERPTFHQVRGRKNSLHYYRVEILQLDLYRAPQ